MESILSESKRIISSHLEKCFLLPHPHSSWRLAWIAFLGKSSLLVLLTSLLTTGIFADVSGALVVNGTPVALITSMDPLFAPFPMKLS